MTCSQNGIIVQAQNPKLLFAETTDEVQGQKLNFKDFMSGVYEPRLFQPVWGQGGYRPSSLQTDSLRTSEVRNILNVHYVI